MIQSWFETAPATKINGIENSNTDRGQVWASSSVQTLHRPHPPHPKIALDILWYSETWY